MSLLDDLPNGASVGIDTAPFIYLIEQHARYDPVVAPFFRDRIKPGRNQGVTSVITVAEVLVQPLRRNQPELIARYDAAMRRGRHIRLVDISHEVARRAAQLRATFNLRLPDAFQIAAALEHGATHFLTNDARLKKVTDLTVLVLDDYLPAPAL